MASAAGGQLLDLVCGPASPLPETYQRYRLVAHIGSGGQAEVFRAVRLCGGVTSAPMTVKVFRVDPRRPLVDELRSWDKGDAALMDLNNRGVTGICRRADGFYGPPPHKPGERPHHTDAVPYQVYDYLHGINLREYVATKAGLSGEPGARRLSAVGALRTLAGVLRALHHPGEVGATPVLHMDVKPSNVMVLTNGQVRLIDFTGARYWRHEEITQIAYTPEAGGPEAFGGVSQVSPAYDVHGFGAVAYFLVTGAYPRVESSRSSEGAGAGPLDAPPPPWSVLRKHPMLESRPALRDHLHAPVADRPGDRPSTLELPAWVDRLAELVRLAGVPDIGVDWHASAPAESQRIVARATVAGTETGAFQRIERLERELVELHGTAVATAVGPLPPRTRVAEPNGAAPSSGAAAGAAPSSGAGAGAAPSSGAGAGAPGQIRGRASVPPPKPVERSEDLGEPDIDRRAGLAPACPGSAAQPQAGLGAVRYRSDLRVHRLGDLGGQQPRPAAGAGARVRRGTPGRGWRVRHLPAARPDRAGTAHGADPARGGGLARDHRPVPGRRRRGLPAADGMGRQGLRMGAEPGHLRSRGDVAPGDVAPLR